MKAVRLIAPGRPLEMQEVEIPRVGPRDVLVRVKAAGICHSDAHYRAGRSPAFPLPLTLGHEVAGVVEKLGQEVTGLSPGDRVCLHYLATCGDCIYCMKGQEQFCRSGAMIGKHRDGGYAEYCLIPARSVFLLPGEIPFEQGAIMMCSSATSFHALRKGRLTAGESLAVFGMGGLGLSAVQLAQAFGALEVYAVDIRSSKLELARRLGATPIQAGETDPVAEIRRLTGDRGVDVALEVIGLPMTMEQAVKSLAIGGRTVLVGITNQPFQIDSYGDLLNREAEVIGVSDHLAQELPHLIAWVQRGRIDLSEAVTGTIPLDAGAINDVLDRLERSTDEVRVVITP